MLTIEDSEERGTFVTPAKDEIDAETNVLNMEEDHGQEQDFASDKPGCSHESYTQKGQRHGESLVWETKKGRNLFTSRQEE